VLVRSGSGVSGSDRVELIWSPGQLTKTWLEVTVAANSNTRLAAPDVFYFGNAVGDSGLGNTALFAVVNSVDSLGPRNNPQSLLNNIPITNIYDYNRDGNVNSADELIARNNPTNPTTAVKYIEIGALPNAPEAEPLVVASAVVDEPTEDASSNDQSGAVTMAIALAACQGITSPIAVPASIADRLHGAALDTAQIHAGAPIATLERTAQDRLVLMRDELECAVLDLDELLDALFDATGRKQ
jgi:hypothetical protein